MSQAHRIPHPFLFSLLILPFGVVSGFNGVALAYMATHRGLTVEQGAALVAIGFIPHTWKFLWAPIADTTLSRRKWYLLSVILSAVGIVGMSAVPLNPQTLPLVQLIVLLTNFATTTLGMAVEGLMAHLTPPERRGQVGGWFQAGNLGGSGLGGGAGLWMAMNLPAIWMSGAVLGVIFLAVSAVLWTMPDVEKETREGGLGQSVLGACRDLWDTVKSVEGRLCCLLCFMPIGTGAASSVLAQAEVAARWGASDHEVELVNGLLSGLISAVGCLIGGQLCARFPARKVYAAVGALMAAVAVGMAAAPLLPSMFIVWGLLYCFVAGLAYAAFTGFVLEVIGAGAVATKYSIYGSLANMPIAYMGLVLASSYTAFGPRGMMLVEAGAAVIGLTIMAIAGRLIRPPRLAAMG